MILVENLLGYLTKAIQMIFQWLCWKYRSLKQLFMRFWTVSYSLLGTLLISPAIWFLWSLLWGLFLGCLLGICILSLRIECLGTIMYLFRSSMFTCAFHCVSRNWFFGSSYWVFWFFCYLSICCFFISFFSLDVLASDLWTFGIWDLGFGICSAAQIKLVLLRFALW